MNICCSPSTWSTFTYTKLEGPSLARLDFYFPPYDPMIGENRQLVTNEPVELEKQSVEVQDYMKITDHFRGIYKIYLNLIKENQRMSTCNRWDLQTLRSQPIMPKILPDHCYDLWMISRTLRFSWSPLLVCV